MSPADLRGELARIARALHARGWVANHDGNLSARLDGGRFLCTPTALSKRLVEEGTLLVVDAEGRRVSGRTRPFSEIGLHLTVYRHRPDVRAVVHAHPPTATGFALAGASLATPTSPEAVVSIGPGIPTVPYAPPGAAAEAALAPFTRTHDAVLLGSHGALAWGPDPETAYLRMELVEHVARATLVAQQLGGALPLPEADVAALVGKRRKAGLEPPGAGPEGAGASRGAGGDPIASIIGEEVARALKR